MVGKIIAIDGHASTGKSSLAKSLSKEFNCIHINSGSMYRAITLYMINNDLIKYIENDTDYLMSKLDNIKIEFINVGGKLKLFLNGKNIEKDLNSLDVSNEVSNVASIPQIRSKLVKLQREIDRSNGIIMDGRDIGSVVFPEADLKLFLTASIEVRAERRYDELIKKGANVTLSDVVNNIEDRDQKDSNRKTSPLIIDDDAILIDNTNKTISEQVKWIKEIVQSRFYN
jgi:cytidylate kinase